MAERGYVQARPGSEFGGLVQRDSPYMIPILNHNMETAKDEDNWSTGLWYKYIQEGTRGIRPEPDFAYMYTIAVL
ncbi:hypothetical protein E4U40_002770 [Claviceps sp. LM458 group G5]|nr:hypothetical protein E4U40_002770 [Claviceps sp. LM458 group G5]